jgi:hypothetical protein
MAERRSILVFSPATSFCKIPLVFVMDQNELHPVVEDAEEEEAVEEVAEVEVVEGRGRMLSRNNAS